MALRSEGGLYTSFMERTNWIEPAVSNVVSQLQTKLNELQCKLTTMHSALYNGYSISISYCCIDRH